MRLLLLALLMVFNLQAKSLFSNEEQKNTSEYIENLKNLILATQRTRGLTNSYLNGNTAAMLLVFSNRDDMKIAIGNMESLPLAADPVINARATAISKALTRLNRKAFKQDPKKTFAAYTDQIEQTLMLAQAASKRSAKNLSDFGKAISSTMMELMLPMTEYTGELRGKGAGIAAKGKVTKEQMQDMLALLYQLQSTNKKLQNSMSKIISDYSSKLPQTATTELNQIDKKTKAYMDLIQKKLLKHPEKVNSDEYFDQGTDLIDAIVALYDTSNKAIKEDAKGWL